MGNLPAVRRISLVVDLEGYSKHTAPEQIDAQSRLLWSMMHALQAAGVKPGTCERQDQGDGQLIMLPSGIDEAHVLPTVILALHSALHKVNSIPGPAGRLRMRLALTQGPVQVAVTGYVGVGVVAACRMLDSDPPRKALKRNQDADLVVIVSDDLYDQVFSQGYDGSLSPGDFQPVQVTLRSKGYQAHAWLYVPGARPAPGLVPDFTGVFDEKGSSRSWLAMIPVVGVGIWWGSEHQDVHHDPYPADDQHHVHDQYQPYTDQASSSGYGGGDANDVNLESAAPDWQHDPQHGHFFDAHQFDTPDTGYDLGDLGN